MSGLKRMGLACVFAATLAGGVLVATPAGAASLPAPVCARLASAVEVLTKLAAQYPDNQLIAFLLEKAKAAYANCQ